MVQHDYAECQDVDDGPTPYVGVFSHVEEPGAWEDNLMDNWVLSDATEHTIQTLAISMCKSKSPRHTELEKPSKVIASLFLMHCCSCCSAHGGDTPELRHACYATDDVAMLSQLNWLELER